MRNRATWRAKVAEHHPVVLNPAAAVRLDVQPATLMHHHTQQLSFGIEPINVSSTSQNLAEHLHHCDTAEVEVNLQ